MLCFFIKIVVIQIVTRVLRPFLCYSCSNIRYYKLYIYNIHIYYIFYILCHTLYIYNIATSILLLFYVVFEATLLNYAKPCRNWTFQSLARGAEKKERSEQIKNLTLARIYICIYVCIYIQINI